MVAVRFPRLTAAGQRYRMSTYGDNGGNIGAQPAGADGVVGADQHDAGLRSRCSDRGFHFHVRPDEPDVPKEPSMDAVRLVRASLQGS